VAATGCSRPKTLSFVPQLAPVNHDAEEVLDLAVVDVEDDGVLEIVACRPDGLYLLRLRDGRWQDATPGTGLDRIAPVDALVAVGRDLVATREGRSVHLLASDIGTWAEMSPVGDDGGAAASPTEAAPGTGPVQVDIDLNGDGALDRAVVDGRIVRVLLRDMAGRLDDVTTIVASDALPLRASGRRILAADLDGDGDIDLVATGGRILILLSNGGALDSDVRA
jgi:hypothetical protein